MTSYLFLSDDWIKAAKSLQDEYIDRIPTAPIETQINVIIKKVAHQPNQTVDGHIDTTKGTIIIEKGLLESPELTVTLDYETAKAAFVNQDQQKLMEAFMAGKILVEGDASKLLALQANTNQPSPLATEFQTKIQELTKT